MSRIDDPVGRLCPEGAGYRASEEVVRVLDSFAELEARSRQCAHWRDRLLAFPEKPAV